MARAVLPRASARAIWLLTGRTESVPSSVARAPPLDDDADGGEDDEEAEEMWCRGLAGGCTDAFAGGFSDHS